MEMDFNSILNVLLRNKAFWKAGMPLIGMSGMPQVRMGVIGQAMQLIGNHTHVCAIRE